MLAPFPRPVEDAPQGARAPSLRTLLDAESDALSWTPQLLGKVSAWWKHVPFAFWLVSVTKPRVIVELGTHNGISYAAFCEAVVRQNLVTQCFAVDTWKGDEQAGFYGEDAFEDLNTLNAGRYGAFSELLRMTFDEACDTFADGSIDLLHIDGFHSYEAVKHDFATWRRKLSPQAVVLLHDTNVHQSDFGVHRLFRELAQGLPSFEFFHGHGLGLLAIGNKPPAVVTDLCGQLADEDISHIRNKFCRIGTHWHDMSLTRATLNAAVKTGQQTLDRLNALAARRGWGFAWPFRRRSESRQAAMIRASIFFDPAWYLTMNPELAQTGLDPAKHYLEVGGIEGRDPGPLFSTRKYLDLMSLAPGQTNPLLHYLKHGKPTDFAAALELMPD